MSEGNSEGDAQTFFEVLPASSLEVQLVAALSV